MLDLTNDLDVFIITNGRSTFTFSQKSIENQKGVNINIHVIKNKRWVEANNFCVNKCLSRRFLRVDDDMILHPRALLFLSKYIQRMSSHDIMFFCKLWEPWTRRPVNGIKIYTVASVKKIGGFRANKIGKIDANFKARALKYHYRISANKSMIGIHSCSTAKENIRYAKMRGEQNGRNFNYKVCKLNRLIGKYKTTLEAQYNMATGNELRDINKRYKTEFYRFINYEQK